MAKEMTAVEYLKTYKRMCDSLDRRCSFGCPMHELKRKSAKAICREAMIANPEEAVAIVQKWAEEHPVKTILDDFFEKFPNAPRKKSGEPIVCPESLGYRTERNGCHTECYDCWNRLLEVK